MPFDFDNHYIDTVPGVVNMLPQAASPDYVGNPVSAYNNNLRARSLDEVPTFFWPLSSITDGVLYRTPNNAAASAYDGDPVNSVLLDIWPSLEEWYHDMYGDDYRTLYQQMILLFTNVNSNTPTREVDGKTYILVDTTFNVYTNNYRSETPAGPSLWVQYRDLSGMYLQADTNKWYDIYVENILGKTITATERYNLSTWGGGFDLIVSKTKEEISANYNIPVDQIPADVIEFRGRVGAYEPKVEIADTVYLTSMPSNIDYPVTAVYWDVSDFFGEGSIDLVLPAAIAIETSAQTTEVVNIELNVTVPKIPGELTKTTADLDAIIELLNSVPDGRGESVSSYTYSNKNVTRWMPGDNNPQTIHNIAVTDNETPAGEEITIVGAGTEAPDPLAGFTVEYSTVTINTPNDHIENEGSAVIIQPGGDIMVNTGTGMVLDAPQPTMDTHVVTKRYVDDVVTGGNRSEVVDRLYETIFEFPVAPVVTINFSLGGTAREAKIVADRIGYDQPTNIIFNSYDDMIKLLQHRCWDYKYSLRRSFMPTEEQWNDYQPGDSGDFN